MKQARFLRTSLDKNPSHPALVTLFEASTSSVMKKSLSMSPSEEIRLTRSSKEDSRSRIENSKRKISLILDALVSVFKSTSIWE